MTPFQRHAERGSIRFVRDGNIVHLQWKDKRPVTVISTMHSAVDFVNVTRKVKENNAVRDLELKKPKLIDDYNFAMGGVDLFDQHVSTYRVLRKTRKYWKTLLFDFVDVALVNSWVLFQQWVEKNPGVIKTTRENSHLDYRLAIIRQLADIMDKTDVPLLKPGPTQGLAKTPKKQHGPVHTDKRH